MDVLAPMLTYTEYRRRPEPELGTEEIVDGVLIARDAPGLPHQVALIRLGILVDPYVPPGLMLVPAPFDWMLRREPLLVRQPDLLVARSVDLPEEGPIEVPPVLAVEILSPSSVETDRVHKPREYAGAGLDHLWLVDPGDRRRIRIEVFRRQGARWAKVAEAVDREELVVIEPFDVRLRPRELASR